MKSYIYCKSECDSVNPVELTDSREDEIAIECSGLIRLATAEGHSCIRG